MPFEETVKDDEILDQFHREDLGRNVFTYSEIAEGIDSVTPEAIRQRLVRMEGEDVESIKVGGVRLWYDAEAEPTIHADGGIGLPHIPDNLEQDLQTFVGQSVTFTGRLFGGIALSMAAGVVAIELLGLTLGIPQVFRYALMFGLGAGLTLLYEYRPGWIPFTGRTEPTREPARDRGQMSTLAKLAFGAALIILGIVGIWINEGVASLAMP